MYILGLQLWHMEVPRPGVKSELTLPAYTTATATWDPAHICDLHHSSWQRWILDPLSSYSRPHGYSSGVLCHTGNCQNVLTIIIIIDVFPLPRLLDYVFGIPLVSVFIPDTLGEYDFSVLISYPWVSLESGHAVE